MPPLPCELLQTTDINLANLVEEVSNNWLPKENLSTLDWMESNLYLPKEESDKDGLYDSDVVPYFWGIAHAFDNPEVEMVVVQKAAQIGWTLLLCGWLFKVITTAPSRILGLFAKSEQVVKFFEDKFNPIGEVCPEVASVIDFSSSRKSGNRANEKKYPGGYFRGFGSNSVSNVKSTPSPIVVVEEPDDTNKSVGDQGDSIRLARERLKRWLEKKFIIGGTPSVEGLSIVEHYVSLGSQRVLPITCHDCEESHVLDWENVSWMQSDSHNEHPVFGVHLPETAVYCCPLCGSVWDDWRRKKNVYDTCKKARDGGDNWAGWVATVDTGIKNQSFKDLSELYVCLKGTSLSDVVEDYLEAEKEASIGEESARIVFQNSKLAKTYAYKTDAPDTKSLEERAEDYDEWTIPDGGLVITAGVDVQHDRLAIIVRAWGRDEESWLVFWGEIFGDTKLTTDPVWDELSSLLFRVYHHEKGYKIGFSAGTIDTSDGTTSDAAYSWVKKNKKYRIMAGKGSSDTKQDSEIFSPPRKSVDSSRDNLKASKYGVKPYIVGTLKSKDVFTSRLKLTGKGPAVMHWYKSVRQDYYDQITSEVKAPHRSIRGKLVYQCRSGVRNEAFDCERYALHAARSLKLHARSPKDWDDLEKRLMQVDLFSQSETSQKNNANPKTNVISKGVEI